MGRSNEWLQGSTALIPAMQDVMRGNDAYYERNLAQLGEDFQREQVTKVAGLGAQRLAQFGPEGQWWAEALQRDPHAAFMMAEQMGGFDAIEQKLQAAHAAGAASQAIGQMQQSGAKPQEIVDFIFRTQGPEKAKAAREALGIGGEGAGPASYTTAQGVFVRDSSGPNGYRRAGDPYSSALVNINNGDMRPDQEYTAEDRSRKATETETQKLRDALDSYDALVALTNKIRTERRAPTGAETDSLVKMAARLENPEMVGEGDMARKAGGGVTNYFRSVFNQPFELDGNQFDNIISTAGVVAKAKADRLSQITSAAQGVASTRGLNPAAVVPVPHPIGTTPTAGYGTPPVGTPPGSGGQAAAKTLPPRDQLVEGEVYQTSKGAARWNGASFSLVK